MGMSTGPSPGFWSQFAQQIPAMTNAFAGQFGDPQMAEGVRAAGSAMPRLGANNTRKQMRHKIQSQMQPYPKAPMMNPSMMGGHTPVVPNSGGGNRIWDMFRNFNSGSPY